MWVNNGIVYGNVNTGRGTGDNSSSNSNKILQGDGNLSEVERGIENFHSINVVGPLKVHFETSESSFLSIKGDANLLESIRAQVGPEGTLELQPLESWSSVNPITITCGSPAPLKCLSVIGSGDISAAIFNGVEVSLSVQGSGDIDVEGDVETVIAKIQGSGDIDASELQACHGEVAIMGSGDLSLHCSESVKGQVLGSGDVDVYGEPSVRHLTTMGSGNVQYRSGPAHEMNL